MKNLGFVIAVAAACGGGNSATSTGSAAPPSTNAPTPVAAAPAAPTPAVAAPTPAATAPTPAAPAAPATTAQGTDFIDDAKLLYRIAACGAQDQPIPDSMTHGDAKLADKLIKTVERHCKPVLDRMGEFKKTYFDKGRAWFDEVVPKDAPKTVVYPFGGGDLLSALVAFPDATEITTISLEMAGDPRRLRTLSPSQLEGSLGGLRAEIGGLVSVGSNTSENLSKQQRNELPGQVSSFLLGLVAGGYEPVSMRYFTIDGNGVIHYLDQSEIDTLDKEAKAHRPKSLKHDWMSPNFSQAFANVEIQYRKIGDTAVRVHRHIGWNLGDDYLTKHPELLRHLEQKGQVTMLTKGASYLLWSPNFSVIRSYMLEHLAWMLSDSTGIPPQYARQAGMVQVTYGYYHGAFLEGPRGSRHDEAFVDLWAKNPRKKLAFRFGYVDKDMQAHLVVTKPRS
jgi:hypothetical protein